VRQAAPVVASDLRRDVVVEEKEHRSLGDKIKDALGLGAHKESHEEHIRYGPNGERIVEKIDTEYNKK